jgi:hypothetical protein
MFAAHTFRRATRENEKKKQQTATADLKKTGWTTMTAATLSIVEPALCRRPPAMDPILSRH